MKAEFFIDVLSDILSALLSREIAPLLLASQASSSSMGSVTIDGIFGDFTIDGSHVDFLDAEITAEIDKDLLSVVQVGDQFFNELSFFDRGRAFGVATITGIIDSPQFGVITVALPSVDTQNRP